MIKLGIEDGQKLGHRFCQMFKVVQVLENGRLCTCG